MSDRTGDEMRRRVKRGAIALGLLAFALYVGFIVMSVARGAA
ncbi:MAG TPA: hypothetical protein PK681_05640 [Steroidobacteraceae bacterium]|nr:hypothetical protein [Steroidobacteraceae bacterium]HQX47714.1 hypothetical protein [Steroidobacteraceae bacterium]HQX78394.1 hypothetical protein [Steroidobacteraceae bacterium]HQZ80084.1 hypothetical protein [Steroidobacteraceae bacterium]